MAFAGAGNDDQGEKAKVLLLRTAGEDLLPHCVLQTLMARNVSKCLVGGAGDQSRMQKSFGTGIAEIRQQGC